MRSYNPRESAFMLMILLSDLGISSVSYTMFTDFIKRNQQ